VRENAHVEFVNRAKRRTYVLWDWVNRFRQGFHYGENFKDGAWNYETVQGKGPLEKYFDRNTTGPGLWKFRHYFPIYERHLAKFVNHEVHIVEIGIFSGGSLGLWKGYFGPDAHIYGVDIEPDCRVYEAPGVSVFIGDQSDRQFWNRFVSEVPQLDIIIDDGGHLAHQQIPTFEALFPRLRPGGVYICEDVMGLYHAFLAYVMGLTQNLHLTGPRGATDGVPSSDFQRVVDSVHVYPSMIVIEKRAERLDQLIAPKHGTDWQPFLNVQVPESPQEEPSSGA